MQFPRRPERGVARLGTGVIDGCEVPCTCGELNLHSPEEQQVLLSTESTLQHLKIYLFFTPQCLLIFRKLHELYWNSFLMIISQITPMWNKINFLSKRMHHSFYCKRFSSIQVSPGNTASNTSKHIMTESQSYGQNMGSTVKLTQHLRSSLVTNQLSPGAQGKSWARSTFSRDE